MPALYSHAACCSPAPLSLDTPTTQFSDDDVKILSGVDEGAFAWLTLNYLLGKLGGGEDDTGAGRGAGGMLPAGGCSWVLLRAWGRGRCKCCVL